MKALFSLLLLLFVVTIPASAQSQERDWRGVKSTIDNLFDGMRAGDSTAVRAVFAPGARLVSSGNRPDGTPFVQVTPTDAFINAVGSPHPQIWDERVWDLKIDIEGNLASAWMNCAFYAGDQFSHCGVNHFQMVREQDGIWRAVALSDTRTPAAECDLDANQVEESAVEAALRNYLSGHATGRGSYFEKVFHPVSSLYWVRDGELTTRTSEAYIAGASGNPPANESERDRYIDWVDVSGTAAVAKIVLDYPGAYYTDYMSMLKVDGRWQIISKIFDVQNQ